MLKMVDGTGIIGVDMVCPLGVSTPQPPNYDRVELEGTGMLVLPNSLDAPLERLELSGKTEQVQTTGAQLFEASRYEGVTKNGVTVTVKDGVITATGTPNINTWIQVFVSRENYQKLFKPENKIYLKTNKSKDCNYDFGIYGAFGSPILGTVREGNSGKELPAELPRNDTDFYFFIDVKIGTELKGSIKPIVYHDGDGTWEPYTGGKPSPSPEYLQEIKNSGKWNEGTQKYEVDVKVTGKNLFDKRLLEGGEIVEFNGVECYKYIDNNHNFKYKRKFENGQQYAFTLRILRPASKESNATDMAIVYTDGSIKQMRFRHGELKTFVSDNGKTIDYFSGGYNFSTDCYLDLIVTRLSVGGQDTGYEPYKEQTLTLALDQPLRGIGEMKDELSESGILRRVKSIALNGSEKWYKYENSAFVAMNCYGLKIDDLEARNYSLTTLCNFFKWARFPQDIESQTAHGGYIYFTVPKETYPDLESFKGWLAKNTPVLEYRLKEPALEELSEEDKASVRALKTYYPTTVITVDGGELDPDIKVTYRKEI